MKDLSNFYPETVYFCDCLKMVIDECKKASSLQYFYNEINDKNNTGNCIYSVRCGDDKKDNVFSCFNHIPMGTFQIQYTKNSIKKLDTINESFCLICIKKYLRRHYNKFLFKTNI